jgi:glycerol-3-phosphate dehydrogenase
LASTLTLGKRDPRSLAGSYDLIIVGGGIVGTGIARDASRRGLKVLLLEQEDYGYGTTARSSRLIHGGLRYLAHLDFRLVRKDLEERQTLLRIAPHLVRPVSFLIPVYGSSGWQRLYLGTGLHLYDILARGSTLPKHVWLPRADALAMEPRLEHRRLQGAFRYHDAQVDMPERLCIENLLDSASHGGVAFNYTRVHSLTSQSGRVTGVEVEDLMGSGRHTPKAKLVVNAAGPWASKLLGGLARDNLLRLSRGTHIITDPISQHAIVTFSQRDGRLMFIIPWLGNSLIGTTDIEYNGDPAAVRPTRAEVDYLRESARQLFPQSTLNDPHYSLAGLRALVASRKASTSRVTRAHRVIIHSQQGGPECLISVFGGKLTGYRHIAEQVTDIVCRQLGHTAPCTTREEPLPSARGWQDTATSLMEQLASKHVIAEKTQRHLAQLHGARLPAILNHTLADPTAARPLYEGCVEILAQVRHAVLCEGAQTVADVLLRRCTTGLEPGQGHAAAACVASEIGNLLGWSEERVAAEIATYETTLARDLPNKLPG